MNAHRRRKGKWPTATSGRVLDALDESWHDIDRALHRGNRGLSGGESLAELLRKRRGARPRNRKPQLSIAQILTWADAHYRRFRRWPDTMCGRVVGTLDESWHNIDSALNRNYFPRRRSGTRPRQPYRH